MKKNEPDTGEIIIYQTSKKEVELKVRLKKETVWLDTHQIAKLFDVDRTGSVRHIRNIYKSGELKRDSTCAKIAQVAKDGKVRTMDFYNLDMIISVGYRVNSKRATQFRIWATNVLKNYLVKGYVVNQKQLLEEREKFRELQGVIVFLQEKAQKEQLKGQEKEILNLLAGYAKTLSVLEQYDKGKLKKPKGQKEQFVLEFEDCRRIIRKLKKELINRKEAGDLFGKEPGGAFEGIVKNLYQTFGGK